MNPLLIKNALLVNEDTIFPADLPIKDGRIGKKQPR